MNMFQGQDHEGSNWTELATFRGKLLQIEDIRSTKSLELIDRFWQRLSASALVPSATAPN